MIYNFRGRNINIPDNEISIAIKNLGITKSEAIEMYLEDNGFLENEQVEMLTKKAKENKAVQHKAKSETTKKKETPKKERKPDEEKSGIIKKLSEFLESLGYNPIITNVSKMVEFDIGSNHYKLDLIKQNKKLAEKKAKEKE